jgi:thioredoxin reductase
MTEIVDVAIIGAGPYGLSLAAHLAALGVKFRIFGSPMHTWRTSMPEGMVLKSEGNASSLYDPAGEFSMQRYCADNGLPYKDIGYPIPLTTFIDYGIAFQRRYVPNLEEKLVTDVTPGRSGFELKLDSGESVSARRVVVATGIRDYEYIPPELSHLPPELGSHSAAHVKVNTFRDRDVAVIGAGASAINLAALLHQNGARITLVSREPTIDYCGPPSDRPLMERIKEPESGLGTGWRSWACCAMPMVFHAMPESFRVMIVRKHLPAAPGWTLRTQVDGIVPMELGARVKSATESNGRVALTLSQLSGGEKTLMVDHVISGTGYRVDTGRLAFLRGAISSQLDCIEKTPRLSRFFESSVPGLYFVGTSASNAFGPMLRFAYGAKFTSKRLSEHLVRALARQKASPGPAAAAWGQPAATNVDLART